MAQPKTIRFGMFAVMLGTFVASPVYSAPCGFNSKSLTLSKELNDISIPDCDNPDAPAWIGRDVSSMSASVTGEGVVAESALPIWLEAYKKSEPVPVKIVMTGSAQTYTFTGKMHVASLAFEAELGGRVNITVDLQSDGELSQTSAATV